mmetsp:Transcript_29009/g.55639  ORF Transcript_29009/g.55639 Transcript_29009/m.55639 type:complete len:376 (+) Transcript_29009:1324-2451(+)
MPEVVQAVANGLRQQGQSRVRAGGNANAHEQEAKQQVEDVRAKLVGLNQVQYVVNVGEELVVLDVDVNLTVPPSDLVQRRERVQDVLLLPHANLKARGQEHDNAKVHAQVDCGVGQRGELGQPPETAPHCHVHLEDEQDLHAQHERQHDDEHEHAVVHSLVVAFAEELKVVDLHLHLHLSPPAYAHGSVHRHHRDDAERGGEEHHHDLHVCGAPVNEGGISDRLAVADQVLVVRDCVQQVREPDVAVEARGVEPEVRAPLAHARALAAHHRELVVHELVRANGARALLVQHRAVLGLDPVGRVAVRAVHLLAGALLKDDGRRQQGRAVRVVGLGGFRLDQLALTVVLFGPQPAGHLVLVSVVDDLQLGVRVHARG